MSEVVLLESTFEIPPNQDNLPSDDGIPMKTQRHKLQMDLLVDTLTTHLSGQDAYVGGNMFVYFSPYQVKNHDFRGPDVFVVLDVSNVERKEQQKNDILSARLKEMGIDPNELLGS